MLRMTASLLTSFTTHAKLVEIKQNILELILLEQVAQVLDNLSSALDVLDDVDQDVAELVERGGVASRNRRAAWALARIPASGWFSSWASEQSWRPSSKPVCSVRDPGGCVGPPSPHASDR